MKRLSDKEEEIMGMLWSHGPMFVREMLDLYPEPQPHFNTVSTFVRGLEVKGMLTHERVGNSFRYIPTVSAEQYRRETLPGLLSRLFGGSGLKMVSALVKEEVVSPEELRQLLAELEESDTDSHFKHFLNPTSL